MMELVDIWGDTIPSSCCLTTVFEKQAKLLASIKKNKHTKQPQMEYFCQQSLRAINQLGNGFRVENFEGIIQFWAKEWHIPPPNPCAICFEFFLAKDTFQWHTSLANVKHTTAYFYPGDRILCRFKNHHYTFFEAAVEAVNHDGTYAVQYDDGDHEASVPNEVGQNKKGTMVTRMKLVARGVEGAKMRGKSPVRLPCVEHTSACTSECNTNVVACKSCVRDYCRVEMKHGTSPLWNGVPCFCGCNAVLPDHTIQQLWCNTTLPPDLATKMAEEYKSLERQLRHRRVAADPCLRYCPNPACKSDTSVTKIDVGRRSSEGAMNKTENTLGASPRIILNGIAVVNTEDNNRECWKCCLSLCTTCGGSAHEGECVANHDACLEGLVTSNNDWVRCTKCTLVLERVSGCDHMTCRCGAEFCFSCGAMPYCGVKCKKIKKEVLMLAEEWTESEDSEDEDRE